MSRILIAGESSLQLGPAPTSFCEDWTGYGRVFSGPVEGLTKS